MAISYRRGLARKLAGFPQCSLSGDPPAGISGDCASVYAVLRNGLAQMLSNRDTLYNNFSSEVRQQLLNQIRSSTLPADYFTRQIQYAWQHGPSRDLLRPMVDVFRPYLQRAEQCSPTSTEQSAILRESRQAMENYDNHGDFRSATGALAVASPEVAAAAERVRGYLGQGLRLTTDNPFAFWLTAALGLGVAFLAGKFLFTFLGKGTPVGRAVTAVSKTRSKKDKQ